MKPTQLYIASDHAGFDLKEALKTQMPDLPWNDLGPSSADRVDYPDFAAKLGREVAAADAGEVFGILVCGSGIGMSIAANKVTGVRAALVENPISARLSREHNDANVLCLGARFLAPEYAQEIISAWLGASFEGGRHQQRVDKINSLD